MDELEKTLRGLQWESVRLLPKAERNTILLLRHLLGLFYEEEG